MEEDVAAKLRLIPLFERLQGREEDLARLARIVQIRRAPAGTVLFREGDEGDEMYIVLSGGVEIKKRTRAGDDYTVVRLSAEDNVFFGELALVDESTRSATVIAEEASEFIVITRNSFIALGDRFPHIGLPVTRAIAEILAARLRKTTGDMLTVFDALVHELQE